MKRINNDNTTTQLGGGATVFTWSDWISPDDFKIANVPARAGIYMLRVVNQDGKPVSLMNRKGSDLDGVIYIGMTGSSNTLKNRLMDLVRAWRTLTNWKAAPHGSRKHFDDDPVAQALLKGHSFQVRFQSLPTAPKTESKELTDFANSKGITAEGFRLATGTSHKHDEHVSAHEEEAIQRFKRENDGKLPILNRDDDGKNNVQPTDEWMDEHLNKIMESSNFIESEDADNLEVDSPREF